MVSGPPLEADKERYFVTDSGIIVVTRDSSASSFCKSLE